MNPFTLGRMRHLDLLARYFELHPGGHRQNDQLIGAMPTRWLITTILEGTP